MYTCKNRRWINKKKEDEYLFFSKWENRNGYCNTMISYIKIENVLKKNLIYISEFYDTK